ncbi:Trm112 family protein [Aliikangiella marina]|uniref:UPF0434 protein FLL45_04990 n=1 Tax=Aliikangiella marina TaxID=1712262 RepID=A0A545TJ89_9GAMM|nr:Trm112 family protein [Aliikangiella marina]TQV77304.1 Trm112 family protein [Aliikangiella marina]
MDKNLFDILVCPLCNSKLSLAKDEKQLICKFDRLSFPFDEEIPVLIPDRATSLTKAQLDEING